MKARRARSPAAGSRGGLSAAEIAQAALELTNREGLEALSMRRLASELGIGAMTLYGYFADKDALIDAIVDLAASEIRLPAGQGPWRTRLGQLADEIRRVLQKHPAGLRIRFTRPMLTPGAMRTTEVAMRILLDGGFTPAEAARAYRTVFLYTFGFASFTPDGAPAEVQRATSAALSSLSAEEFPAVAGAIDELAATMSGDEQFHYGLQRLFDGLEHSASSTRIRPQ